MQWVQQSIKNITEDSTNEKACYVTHEDICKSFEGDTLLAVQAPHGTQLEVPIPEMQANQKRKYQIHLKSTDGQIYVLLVNKDSEHEQPVAVQVPPPADVAEAIEKASENLTRQVGKKSKFAQGSDELKAAKKIKLAEDDSEVESILSGKVLNTEIPGLTDFMSSESKSFLVLTKSRFSIFSFFAVFGPIMRLSPPPCERDYCFNLDENEGVCDLFDVM